MSSRRNGLINCQICGRSCRRSEAGPVGMLHGPLHDRVAQLYPDLTEDSYICLDDLNALRRTYIEDKLRAESTEMSALQQEVLKSIRDNESLLQNLNTRFESRLTFGEHLADKVAEFGGSWKFISIFGAILFIWIVINSLALLYHPFDPFPFILLNLVLSCVASIQAPVIMMSQNRQEAKDRLRAEEDFRTNLKAELEIRNLNAKIDELLTHQWQRLLEIQQVQLDMMEQMTSHHRWERENIPPAQPVPAQE